MFRSFVVSLPFVYVLYLFRLIPIPYHRRSYTIQKHTTEHNDHAALRTIFKWRAESSTAEATGQAGPGRAAAVNPWAPLVPDLRHSLYNLSLPQRSTLDSR